ncbi:putative RNA-binding Zn ribbon-like protein [Brevibacterium pityocampae]
MSNTRDMDETSMEVAIMSSELPAWELEFRFEGGLLPLAFTATVGERWQRNFERLTSPQRWAEWLMATGLVDQAPTTPTEADLDAAKVLREGIYRAIQAVLKEQVITDGDIATINAFAAAPPTIPALTSTRQRRQVPASGLTVRCLSDIARRAIDMLADDAVMSRVRECDAPDCALLFYDASRPGRRRWCSDGGCGTRNRARHRRSNGRSAFPRM